MRRIHDYQRETVFNRLGNRNRNYSYEQVIEDFSINVFVTGFPSHLTVRELWKICEKHGNVVDVFIAPRLSKSGKPFGFVKYSRVDHEDILIEQLCNVFIGHLKIHANKARFNREKRKTIEIGSGSKQGQPSHVNANKPLPAGNINRVPTKYTYATVLKRGTIRAQDEITGEIVKGQNLLLDDSCLNPKTYKFAAAGCLKEFNSLPNLRSICKGEGFENVTLRYLGGYWVLCQFTNEDSRESFLQHEGVNSWFDRLHKWNGEVNDNSRVVWLDIEGVPPFIWSSETFTRLAKQWGSLVNVDDSKGTNLYSIRLCVKTTVQSIILESFDVSWRGKAYTVRAKEVTGWLPDFVNPEEHTIPIHDGDTSEDYDVEEVPDSDLNGKVNDEIIDDDGSIDEVPDSFADSEPRVNNNNTSNADKKDSGQSPNDSDPFKLQSLIEKVMGEEVQSEAKTPTHPPGFTPRQSLEAEGLVGDNIQIGDGVIGSQVRNEGAADSADVVSHVNGAKLPDMEMEQSRNLNDLAREDPAAASSSRTNTMSELKKTNKNPSPEVDRKIIHSYSMVDNMSCIIDMGKAMGYNMAGVEENMNDLLNTFFDDDESDSMGDSFFHK